MLIFSFIMGFVMGGRLAMIFLVTIPLLGVGLFLVIRAATPLFRSVFRKYDALNDSVQENVQAMRVVKSYVREEYEKKKFGAAAEDVQKDFTKAERIMAINSPMMQFCVYAGMVFVLSYGSYAVITSKGLDLNVGQMSSMLTYSFQIQMCIRDRASMIGADYDDPQWDSLLDQMTFDEMNLMITQGFHNTKAAASIGKTATKDENGPQGLTAALTGGASAMLSLIHI